MKFKYSAGFNIFFQHITARDVNVKNNQLKLNIHIIHKNPWNDYSYVYGK